MAYCNDYGMTRCLISEHVRALLPAPSLGAKRRWVVEEALSGIGLAATEPAASALLKEGLRCCEFLLHVSNTDSSSSSNSNTSATLPAAVSGSTSKAAQAGTQPSAATSGGDGWDFGDGRDFDDLTTVAAAAGPASSTTDGGNREEQGAAAGAPGPARKESRAADEGDRDSEQEEVARLRARLASLRRLFETFLAVDGASQGRAFDVVRLRDFLALASPAPGESGGEQRREKY